MTPLAKWNLVYDRFDSFNHMIDSAWVVPRLHSPAKALITKLNNPREHQPILLLGTIGCGKTTELQHISRELSKKHFVVFLDLHAHFESALKDAAALERVQPWEVCFLAGVALIKAVKVQYDYDFDPLFLQQLSDTWSKLATETHSIGGEPKQLNLSALAKSMAVLASEVVPGLALGGKLVEAVAEALPWDLPIGKSKKKLEDQDQPIRDLLQAVNRMIAAFRLYSTRSLVLVIDGLDRIRSIPQAADLFRHSNLIASLDCRLVICGPVALRHSTKLTETRFEPYLLFNEPVLLQSEPSREGPGVDFFLEVYKRRTQDFDPQQTLLPAPHLRRLAYYSGGRIRGFLTLIRSLAEMVYEEPVPDASSDEMIEQVLDAARRRVEMGLHKGHIKLLQELVDDDLHQLPEGELAAELLADLRLFPYSNGSEWFYPHSLLTINLLK